MATEKKVQDVLDKYAHAIERETRMREKYEQSPSFIIMREELLKEKKTMFGKKKEEENSIEKKIEDEIKRFLSDLSFNSDVRFSETTGEYPYCRKLKVSGLEQIDILNKRVIKENEELTKRLDNQSKNMDRLQKTLKKICPHENVVYGESNDHHLQWKHYFTDCEDCGNRAITFDKVEWLKKKKKALDDEIKTISLKKKR